MNNNLFLKIAVSLISIIIFINILIPATLAFEVYKEDLKTPMKEIISIGLYADYRTDNLEWSIAGPEGNPDILSELKFNDLEIHQTGINVKTLVNHLYCRASAYSGTIEDGKGSDSDYFKNDRKGIYSESVSEISNDDVSGHSIGFGYQFELLGSRLQIFPLAGIANHKQNIRQKNGTQTISTPGETPGIGPIKGLDSTYTAKWETWWFGMDICVKMPKNLSLQSSLEYHTASYDASADWNLRDDFEHPVSFTHEADGKGSVIKIGITYTFIKHFISGLHYYRYSWSTDNGIDRLFLESGETISSRLNKVSWESQGIGLYIECWF